MFFLKHGVHQYSVLYFNVFGRRFLIDEKIFNALIFLTINRLINN